MGLRDVIEDLEREEKQEEVREIIVRENEVVKEINRDWRDFFNRFRENQYYLTSEIFGYANEMVGDYKSKDITLWSIGFSVGEKHRLLHNYTGLFASALVNKSREDKNKLYIRDWIVPPDCIGLELSKGKELVVYGDCGRFAGWGNLGNLLIEGNCGSYAGNANKGGLIIHGDCGYDTGWSNEGTIEINGDIKSLARFKGNGVIYHHGRFISDNEMLMKNGN